MEASPWLLGTAVLGEPDPLSLLLVRFVLLPQCLASTVKVSSGDRDGCCRSSHHILVSTKREKEWVVVGRVILCLYKAGTVVFSPQWQWGQLSSGVLFISMDIRVGHQQFATLFFIPILW